MNRIVYVHCDADRIPFSNISYDAWYGFKELDDAFSAFRLKNQPVPKPLRLPTPEGVSVAVHDLGVAFHTDYRRFQLEVGDVSCGVLEPGLVLPGLPPYIDLRQIARQGWAVVIARDALPFCQDN